MQLTNTRTIQTISYLLLAIVVVQIIFTGFYVAEIKVSRQLFWGVEGVLFTILTALAGAAMVQAKSYHIGWSAIVFSAVFNVVQVSVGVTMFGPFHQAAGKLGEIGPLAGAVVAFSFMIYYAAKLLLGLSAVIFGMAKMTGDTKWLGGLTALTGVVAMLANGVLIAFGRDAFLPSAVAGASGVLATLLLAFCLMSLARESS